MPTEPTTVMYVDACTGQDYFAGLTVERRGAYTRLTLTASAGAADGTPLATIDLDMAGVHELVAALKAVRP